MGRGAIYVGLIAVTMTACGGLLGLGDDEESPAPATTDGADANANANVTSDANGGSDPDAADASGACAMPRGPIGECAADMTKCTTAPVEDSTPDTGHTLGVALTASEVFWLSQNDDGAPANGYGSATLLAKAKSGMTPSRKLAVDQSRARELVLDGAFVYWVARTPTATFELRRVPTSCTTCTVEPLVTIAAADVVLRLARVGPEAFVAMDVNGRSFYVRREGGAFTVTDDVLPVKGGSPSLAVFGEHVYGGSATSATVSWKNVVAGTFGEIDLGGRHAYQLAASCEALFAADPLGALFRIEWDGSVGDTITTIAPGDAFGADADFVYYSGGAASVGIARMRKTGGAVETIRASSVVRRLAVGDDGIWFGDADLGGLLVTRK